MKIYLICLVLFSAPAVFGLFLPGIEVEFAKYRDDCISKIGLTNTDVIRKIKSRDIPDDGSADRFTICMLQTFSVLNEDATVNPIVSSYYLVTDYRFDAADICVPKSGSISGREATKIFKCLHDNGILVLP